MATFNLSLKDDVDYTTFVTETKELAAQKNEEVSFDQFLNFSKIATISCSQAFADAVRNLPSVKHLEADRSVGTSAPSRPDDHKP